MVYRGHSTSHSLRLSKRLQTEGLRKRLCHGARRLDLRGSGSPGGSESFEVDIAPNVAPWPKGGQGNLSESLSMQRISLQAISAEWADVIDQVKNAIVAIRVTAVTWRSKRAWHSSMPCWPIP